LSLTSYTVKKASPLTAFRRFFPASGRGKSLVDNGTFFPASTAGFPAAHIGNKFRHMQNSVFRRLRTIPSPLSSFTSNRRNFPAFANDPLPFIVFYIKPPEFSGVCERSHPLYRLLHLRSPSINLMPPSFSSAETHIVKSMYFCLFT